MNKLTQTDLMWTKNKPAKEGAFWVRGFDRDPRKKALVEVRGADGGLLCNLHERNSEDDLHCWYALEDLNVAFEWCGPLERSDETEDTK